MEKARIVEVSRELLEKKGYEVAGQFLLDIGQPEEAGKLYEEAANYVLNAQTGFSPNLPRVAAHLDRAATAYGVAKDMNKAKELAERADKARANLRAELKAEQTRLESLKPKGLLRRIFG